MTNQLRIKGLEASVAALLKQVAELDSGNGVLLERIAELEAENARLQDAVKQREAECYQAEANLAECTDRIREARYWARYWKRRWQWRDVTGWNTR